MRMTTSLHSRVRPLQQRLEKIAHTRAIERPQELIHMRRQMIDEWEGRARTAMWQLMRQQRQRVEGSPAPPMPSVRCKYWHGVTA